MAWDDEASGRADKRAEAAAAASLSWRVSHVADLKDAKTGRVTKQEKHPWPKTHKSSHLPVRDRQ